MTELVYYYEHKICYSVCYGDNATMYDYFIRFQI